MHIISTIVAALVLGIVSSVWAVTDPTLPTAMSTTLPTVDGTTYNATCATFQAQLNSAAAANVNLTHEVILATGTLCTGPYVLPSHNGGTGWILIKGANHASLPASGTRVSVASHASLMPQIQYGEDGSVAHVGCFSAATGAQRYRIIGIDCVENTGKAPNWAMIQLGYAASGATNTGYLILDRMIIRNRAWSTGTYARRGVYGDAQVGNTAILDSVVTGIADTAAETQAWLSINNPGPILLQNTELEASGENFMFCGATPDSDAVQPRDITIKYNLLSKQAAWFGASGYTVKTEGEMKCGSRTLIEANIFQDMPGNDGGFFHRLTPRNDSYSLGAATFLEVSDLTIRYNTYKNGANWINTIGSDDGDPCNPGVACNTKHAKRWKIHDNLVYGLGKNCIAGADCGTINYFTTGGGGNSGTNLTAGVRGSCTDPSPTCKHEDVQILHNTIDVSGGSQGTLLAMTSDGMLTFDYKDNLVNCEGCAGIYDHGNGWSSNRGTTRLDEAVSGPGRLSAVGHSFIRNRIANGSSVGDGFVWSTSNMPTNNDYVSSYTNIQWVNPCTAAGTCTGTYDYTLNAGSPAKLQASDGTDQGVRWSAFNAAQLGGSGDSSTPSRRFTPRFNIRRAEGPTYLFQVHQEQE